MQRVLLIGGDGMLGSALRHVLAHEMAASVALTVPSRADFDILSARWDHLPVAGHDWVLNAAGVINRRTSAAQERWIVNTAFPHALATLCQIAGSRLVHFSTDCVFDGRQGPFDESAAPGAIDPYGRSKALGEPPTAMTLRTSIIGPERRRFYNLLCWALRQRHIDGYRNHRWNGVTTLALARAVAGLIRTGAHEPGIRHVHAEDVTKHELLAVICRCFSHAAELRAVNAADARDTRLRTRHPGFLAALDLPPLVEQVAELVTLCTPDGAWRPQ